MTRNKQIRTALTEAMQYSQCTVGVVYCVQDNKQIFNYYEGRYDRNSAGNLFNIAVWSNLIVTSLRSAHIARNSITKFPPL
jgi:hypothetical protein